MAKQIAKLLKTDVMADIDMPAIAQLLRSQGRRGDSILAHINPKEAALLQKMGGAATQNPVTGLPEFYDYEPFKLTEDRPDENYVYIPRRQDNSLNKYEDIDFSQYPDIDFNTRDFSDPIENVALGGQPFDRYSQTQKDIVNTINNRSPSSNVTTTYPTARSASAPNVAKGQDEFGFPVMPNEQDLSFQSNRFNVPNVAKGFDEFGFPITQNEEQSFLQLDRTAPNVAKGQDEFGFPIMPDALGGTPDQAVDDGRGFVRRGIDYLKETTGLGGRDLARLGLAAGLGIQGALASREAAKQGREARAEQERIARPYRERGAELLAKAEGGELTPQGQQSLAALRARLAQGAASRGGVGAQQAQAQVENYRQQLLANQYDYGMKISNIGDQLMLGAIRTGLEADRYATNMTSTYYTNMARILVSMGADENDLKEITKPSQGSK